MNKIHNFMEEFLEFKIGETVYLKTDIEQLPRIVYSYTIYPSHIVYNVTQGMNTSGHFDFEISTEKELF